MLERGLYKVVGLLFTLTVGKPLHLTEVLGSLPSLRLKADTASERVAATSSLDPTDVGRVAAADCTLVLFEV
jgi:hypothetical protein